MTHTNDSTGDRECGKEVNWWDGEYERHCILPKGHQGDHWDGLSWYDDDEESKDDEHDGSPKATKWLVVHSNKGTLRVGFCDQHKDTADEVNTMLMTEGMNEL